MKLSILLHLIVALIAISSKQQATSVHTAFVYVSSFCTSSFYYIKFLLHQVPATTEIILQFIFFATANTPFSPSSFCEPTLSPSSYNCGFHTLFSSIAHEQTRCHTHKHMQFLCRYTAGIRSGMFVLKTS